MLLIVPQLLLLLQLLLRSWLSLPDSKFHSGGIVDTLCPSAGARTPGPAGLALESDEPIVAALPPVAAVGVPGNLFVA